MPEEKKEVKAAKSAKFTEKVTSKVVVKKRETPSRPAKPEKLHSFEQWASRRGVVAHHRGGLRAFITNSTKHRTLDEWDACFKGY